MVRPKKEKIEVPVFKSDEELREFLLDTTLELSLNLKEQALKSNNIKNPAIARAKNSQYKTFFESVKLLNQIIRDKELAKISKQLKLLDKGIFRDVNNNVENEIFQLSDEALKELEKIELMSNIEN